MSNRQKPKNRFFKRVKDQQKKTRVEASLEKIDAPDGEKVVIKEVPARAGNETIGTCVIYEDGTFDVRVEGDISEEAREALADFKRAMLGLELGEELPDGPSRPIR